MTGPAFDLVLDRLRAAGRSVTMAGTGKARSSCPAHDGDNKSALSIMDTADRVNLHCFTGNCDGADILTALGLQIRDRYHAPKGDVLATYTYPDGFYIKRMLGKNRDGKDFRSAPRWADRLRPLYRGDQLSDAIASGAVVYLVEGEEDVHALEAAMPDVMATSAPHGAHNFDVVDVEPLRGAKVVAVVDRDENHEGDAWASKVKSRLAGVASTLRFVQSAAGKDAADHVAADHGPDDFVPTEVADVEPEPPKSRQLVLTPASAIVPQRVRWLWEGRIALGTLALLAGKEGLGKSTVLYSVAAQITRGTLDGEFSGTPKAVLVCATEDSWEHTVVPRLIAADADLERVYRVEVINADEIHVGLSLPRDLRDVEQAAGQVDAALLLLDPLLSRLDAKLDTHKDAEVRIALEPLVALAGRARMAVVGIMHHNKSGSTDPLQLVMGSKAFTAVARSVHTVIADPDDEADRRRLFATAKNNLGRADLPVLAFTIESYGVGTVDGTAWTGQLKWAGEIHGTLQDVMNASADDDRSATSEASDWLTDYLHSQGGSATSKDIKDAGAKVGHSQDALKRARKRVGATATASGFPRQTSWNLQPQSEQPSWRVAPTAPTAPTESDKGFRGDSLETTTTLTGKKAAQSVQLVQSVQSVQTPRECSHCGKPLPPGKALHPACFNARIAGKASS